MIKRKSIHLNKKWLLFFIGMAYFIVIPVATFISGADRGNIAAYVTVIIPSLLAYLALSAISYLMRHRIQKLVRDYDLVRRVKAMPEWLYRYRWPVGLVLWLVLTFFQIHGSSIGIYTKALDVPELDSAVIGFSRADRFDEWINMTSFAFSQYVPGPDGSTFNYFNPYLRAVPTDVFIVLGQPVWDICTLFRPFMLGYLFLPQGNGLAFYWTGRLILLALVSYEFARLWTKDQRSLSGIYTLVIVLSPAVQWWFAVNGFVEMLIAGQAAILVLWKYLQCHRVWQQLGWSLLFAYLADMYVYTMYPAWQIPFAYIFLIFALWIIKKYHEAHKWGMIDILCAFLFIGIVVFPLIHTLSISSESVALIRNSEYPGQRFITGGGLSWDWLFNSGLGVILPFSAITEPQFTFNMTQFFDFAPLGILLTVYKLCKTKQLDFLLGALLLLNLVFISFCLLPWPRWLVMATLLFEVPTGRMIIPISFINILLLVRVFTLWPQRLNLIMTVILSDGIALFSAWASFHYCPNAYFPLNASVLIAVTTIGIACICRFRSRLGPFLLGLFLCIGGMVNPVARGTDCIYGTDLAKEISQVTAVDKGNWIVLDNEYTTLNNYPVIFGAPTINSYNTYVAWENWNKLDLKDEDRKALNRCGHIKIGAITEEASTFKSEHGDMTDVTLQREDLWRLGVSYILAEGVDLQPLSTASIQFEPIAWANGQIIYHVNYDKELL